MSQTSKECHQIRLLFFRQLHAEHQVEELNRIFQRQQPTIVHVRRRVLDAPQSEGLDRAVARGHAAIDHLRLEEAFGLEVVHRVIGVVRGGMTLRTACLAREQLFATQLRFGCLGLVELAEHVQFRGGREIEQRAAYFDGDPVIATKKGVNVLERGSQVHFMAEFQELLDFPPAPKLGVDGKLDPRKASEQEMRGQALFHGKAQCASCHMPPHYTDLTMHDLKTERFFKPRMINNMMASADGPIKTFPLRGIKDSPPYLHDGRLLTLDDTVEFFNLILGTQLTAQEKRDLVAFLRTL